MPASDGPTRTADLAAARDYPRAETTGPSRSRRRPAPSVPVEPGVIEESRRRGDRHARGGLTEERVLQVLADRTPARDALELGRTLAREPAELGRPVRRVDVAAGARVQRGLVERAGQKC